MMMQDLYEQKLDQNDGLPEDDLGIVHHMFSRILNLRIYGMGFFLHLFLAPIYFYQCTVLQITNKTPPKFNFSPRDLCMVSIFFKKVSG